MTASEGCDTGVFSLAKECWLARTRPPTPEPTVLCKNLRRDNMIIPPVAVSRGANASRPCCRFAAWPSSVLNRRVESMAKSTTSFSSTRQKKVIMMNPNHLAIFHAVAQTGSMTRGAERLDISQPAVSKQVQELESALGVHLFDRIGRRVHLSQAGEI